MTSRRQIVPTQLNAAQIADACFSYRHDYGLMDGEQRAALEHQAKKWWRCFEKTINDPTPHIIAQSTKDATIEDAPGSLPTYTTQDVEKMIAALTMAGSPWSLGPPAHLAKDAALMLQSLLSSKTS